MGSSYSLLENPSMMAGRIFFAKTLLHFLLLLKKLLTQSARRGSARV
jgi:hypothetical protein